MAGPYGVTAGRISRLFAAFRRAPAAGHAPGQAADQQRWIVAGLGNPEAAYRVSRHNLGFMVADRLATEHDAGFDRRRFHAQVGEIIIGQASVVLLKPSTYYNLSGRSVAAARGYLQVAPQRLLVVHDDLDLEPGQLRLKRGGTDAGNRGVRSIAESLGTPEFLRLRIGIGRPVPPLDAAEWVLKPMAPAELAFFAPVTERAAQAVVAVIAEGLERAMTLYNQRA